MSYETSIQGTIAIEPRLPKAIAESIDQELITAPRRAGWSVQVDRIQLDDARCSSRWIQDAATELHQVLKKVRSARIESRFSGELHYVGSDDEDFGVMSVQDMTISLFAGERVWKPTEDAWFSIGGVLSSDGHASRC